MDVERSEQLGNDPSARASLVYLAILVVAIKLVFLVVDPSPQFFLGDSGSYIHTALTGWIPPGRSYLYGYLIRWLTVGSGSLFSLVLVQALASAGSAAVLGWILVRFIGISEKIATVTAVFYCVDPLQLMYERFVMTETFSLACGMLFIIFLFLFVDCGGKLFLVLASVAGVVTVALRLSFLPLVIALSLAAPAIRFFSGNPEQMGNATMRLRALFVSLAIVAVSHLTLHSSYKLLTGRISGRPSAYQHNDGLALLSSWCPVMTPDDLKAVGVSEQIFRDTYENTLENRRKQLWMRYGIVAALNRRCHDPLEANSLAKKISLHILRRDPLGVATLAIRTYLRGWDGKIILRYIKEDTSEHAMPSGLVVREAKQFHIAAEDMTTQNTLTKEWFRGGTEWYRALLLTPLLLLVSIFFCDQRRRPFLLLVTTYAGVALLTAVGFAVDNSIRYLHPLSWTFFVFAAYWIDILAQRLKKQEPMSA